MPTKKVVSKSAKPKPPTTAKPAPTGRSPKPAAPDAPLLKLPKADDFAFSPDGRRLWLGYTSIKASTVTGIDLPGGEPFVEFSALPNLRGLACSPDGKRLAASNHDGVTALFDATSGKELWRTAKTGEETHALAYAPDGSTVLTSATASCVWRRDARTGRELPPLEVDDNSRLGALAFAPDGKTLAAVVFGAPDGVAFWDWRAGKQLGRFPHSGGAIDDLAYLPDGRSIVTVAYDAIIVTDVKSKRRSARIRVKEGVKCGSLHPGGRLIALRTFDGSQLRELPSGKLLKALDTKAMYPSHIAFSPDGRYLLLVASPRSFLYDVGALISR